MRVTPVYYWRLVYCGTLTSTVSDLKASGSDSMLVYACNLPAKTQWFTGRLYVGYHTQNGNNEYLTATGSSSAFTIQVVY